MKIKAKEIDITELKRLIGKKKTIRDIDEYMQREGYYSALDTVPGEEVVNERLIIKHEVICYRNIMIDDMVYIDFELCNGFTRFFGTDGTGVSYRDEWIVINHIEHDGMIYYKKGKFNLRKPIDLSQNIVYN